MSEHQFEITDGETGEVFEIPLDGMVGGLRDMLISKRRQAIEARTWSRLSEQEQKDEITAAGEFARSVVYKLAEAIAEGGRECAHVSVQKFGVDVDKGDLTVQCKGYATDEVLLDLVHSKGKVVKLTVVDPEQFNRRAKPIKADPDQPPLFPDGEPDPTEAEEKPKKARRAKNQPKDDPEIWAGKPETAPEQTAEEIAADMDADLERMEEPDDLHAEGEETASDEPSQDEGEAPDPEVDGYNACVAGAGPDENPYDGGDSDHDLFQKGYERGKAEVAAIRAKGAGAAKQGKPREKTGWRAGTDAERYWLEGYDSVEGVAADS